MPAYTQRTATRAPARAAAFLPALLLAAVVFLGAWPAWGAEQSLDLDNLVLDNQAGEITVRFGVTAPLDPLRKALGEGSRLGLVCKASLERVRGVLPDAGVAQGEYVSELTRDELAQEYVLHLPGVEKPVRSKDLRVLLDKAWGAVTMDLGSWDLLTPGHAYALNLTISLKRMDVPAWLRYSLFFWSWDVLPATNYQLEFNY